MSKGKKIKKIKKYIDEILNTKSSLIAKRPLKQDKLKKLFCNMLTEIQFVNARAVGMKHDYNLDFTEYDEPFFKAIEASIKLQFSEKQKNLINWWLYDKFLPSGDILVLSDKETEEIIPSDTPEDIWNLIQEHEKKNSK